MSSFGSFGAGIKRARRCHISYARSDGLEYARRLSDALGAAGVDAFLSKDKFALGRDFAQVIKQSVSRADALIFIATPSALTSAWVHTEVSFARGSGMVILPIVFAGRYADSALPMEIRDIGCLQEPAAALESGPTHRAITELLKVLRGRAARSLPAEIVRPPQTLEKRPLNEGKMILVGRGEVGKTSLVRRLVSGDFQGDESKTQGIQITKWPLKLGPNAVRLHVWDFGGQEIMHATHRFFLTEQSLYLLVLNGREGGEDVDVEYWLKHIQSFGGDSPVIVVQNKFGQHPFELNYRGLQARYPQIRAFVRTDCADGTGLRELKLAIEEAVKQMPEIGMTFPADWYRVKERLESFESEFMRYDEFRQLCAEEGITDEHDLDTLSWVLHRLGIALNYRKDSRLRETSVLRPEWVTEGIYKIINAGTLAQRHGELLLEDLPGLLPADRYPADKHAFLIELMRKFGLCFAFPDAGERYLVPDLLRKEEPEELERFVPADCLNFEYHYEVLPEFLVPRFIVRSHSMSHGRPRWRSGVLLGRDNCLALVTSQPADRRVIVRVRGGDATLRRELLAVIRYDLDRINSEFKDALGAAAKVPLSKHPAYSVDYEKLREFERAGIREFPEYVGGAVVTVDVKAHLDGVDLKLADRKDAPAFSRAPSIFFSYAHEDEALRDELETHLKLLQRQRIIGTWHDRKILPGGDWDNEIARELDDASIILLLVSSDFLASDYCWAQEVARAVERAERREAAVVPILLRPCDWEGAPFCKLQGLPKGMRPVTEWPNRDSAWTDVAKGIRALATLP